MHQHVVEVVCKGAAIRSHGLLSLRRCCLIRVLNRQIEQTGLQSHILDGLLVLSLRKRLQLEELGRVELRGVAETFLLGVRLLGGFGGFGDFNLVQGDLAMCHSVGVI